MRNCFHGYSKFAVGIFVLIVALSLIHWIGDTGSLRPPIVEAKITPETVFFDKANPNIRAVMAVQDRHTPDLMALPEVVGTATGLTEAGRPAISVFIKDRVEAGVIPRSLEGVPVVVKVTGEIVAMPKPPWAGEPGGPGGNDKDQVDPTARFERPVPIGVSTGNALECSAGTIGARVKDGSGIVYALSNNHVYALENNAPLESETVQPGLYDTSCVFSEENVIGTLAAFVEIDFEGGSNTVDAAIALSSTAGLGNSTPSDGYGAPKSITVYPGIYENVQKYGRTTGLTKGTVTGVNGAFLVTYSSGTALFVGQIVVESRKPFIKPGDSGSLLVTHPKCNPVGLLFAGNASGKLALANPIEEVLRSFKDLGDNLTIDGE